MNSMILNKSLNPKYLKESYKLYWFLGILEEVDKKNKESINQRDLAILMLKYAWIAVEDHGLVIGRNDKLTQTIEYLKGKEIKSLKMLENMELDDLEFEDLLEKIVIWVKYRFLTPFYTEELKGIIDSRRNKEIDLLAHKDNKVYELTEKEIILNSETLIYLKQNNSILKDWLKYKILVFLKLKENDLTKIYEYLNDV